jgi:hypothetical protein
MRDLLSQIEKGLNHNLYFLSLFTALSIPDICGAMEAEDGMAKGKEYKRWFNEYMVKREPEKYGDGNNFTADDCWNFRCALLHQAHSTHEKMIYKRICFFEPPSRIYIHACVIEANNEREKTLLLDVNKFCLDIIGAAREWLEIHEKSDFFRQKISKLIKRYPAGIKPIFGASIIG